jgi:hypothetical protein
MAEPRYLDAGATFDGERNEYRYRLWRLWDETKPHVAFVMLNPSTADARELDPTLRRCLGSAQRWGCGGFEVGNVYAYRSTDPKGLRKVLDPVGPLNDAALVQIAQACTFGVVAGWGVHAERTRADHVLALLAEHARVLHLGLTASGAPRHPLYLPNGLAPMLWRARRAA